MSLTATEKLIQEKEKKAKKLTQPETQEPQTAPPQPTDTPKHVPTASKAKFTIERLLSERIDHNTVIKPETHISKINGCNFLTNGEISFISGLPKAGKSTIISYVIATALLKEIPAGLDTLKIRSDYTTKNIVYFDTEQSKSGTATTLRRVLKLAGITECPQNLQYFNIRDYSIQDRIEIFKTVCDGLPDLAFVVVDGISDFLTGVNDEISSNEAVEMLMMYSSKLDIPILSIIHETYGGKMRGQFGSQGERKCAAAVSVKKDRQNGCFMIVPKYIRYGADFEDVYYKYDHDTGLMYTLDFEEIQKIKKSDVEKTEKAAELKAILEKIYNGGDGGLTGTDIRKAIGKHQNNKDGATTESVKGLAGRNLKKMIELELIEIREDNLHYYESENKDLFSSQIEPNF